MFMFKPQSNAIKQLADYYKSGIFVGRCANYILNDYNAYSFFIVADDDFRTTRGQLVYHKSLSELKKKTKNVLLTIITIQDLTGANLKIMI